MKAVIEFNLPEEQAEYETHINAAKYYSVLWDLSQWLRSEIKYNDKNDANVLRCVQEKLSELLSEENISL